MSQSVVKEAVVAWLETMVIGLNLCPFAQREWLAGTVYISICSGSSDDDVLAELHSELQALRNDAARETTLLIIPSNQLDFESFLDIVDMANGMTEMLGMEGEFQIASFHPDYCFADAQSDDPGNYTNRAPFPILHVLREQSLAAAIDRYPDTAAIPERNIALMRRLGVPAVEALLAKCGDAKPS